MRDGGASRRKRRSISLTVVTLSPHDIFVEGSKITGILDWRDRRMLDMGTDGACTLVGLCPRPHIPVSSSA